MAGARDHFVELRFADDVAGAVAGLAQIQELFETDQLALRVGPAARGPAAWNLPASSKVISLFWTRSEASPRAARLASIARAARQEMDSTPNRAPAFVFRWAYAEQDYAGCKSAAT